MKRPAFQFYPGDWLRSTDLRLCSVGARGLWIDMICFMHEGNPYGHLRVSSKDILPDNLATMVGAPLPQVTEWLSELEKAGVFSVKNGCIISRRMIRDEKIRESRAKGGMKSLENPNVPRPRISSEASFDPSPASAVAVSSASSSSTPKVKSIVRNGHDYLSEARAVLSYLNRTTGRRYREVDANLKPIVVRLKSGVTAEQMNEVVLSKARQWAKDPKMNEYLRPKTLFTATNFEQYLGEIL